MNPTQLTSSQTLSADDSARIDRIFDLQRANKSRIGQSTASDRIGKLKRLHQAILDYKGEIREAMYRDFRKNPSEVDLTEIYPVVHEIKHAVSHVKKWMKPQRVPTPMAMLGTRSYIRYEPKGCTLIISPWNYPVNLTFGPLVSAIAAGNCVMIKPSEYTPHTSAIIKRIIESLFEEREVALFEGDYTVGAELLKKPFDHIFFTGSPQVGKIVMEAAAKHLSSVTLELGGKSPVIVDKGANLDEAAKKIAWGKFVNKGQTCIAPDYVYVHRSDKDKLIALLEKNIKTYYGESETDRFESVCYARIVNEKHFHRLEHMLQDAVTHGAKVAFGGEVEQIERYIAPTILTGVNPDSEVMQQEIFGPLLPVLTYDSLEEPIKMINSKEKPLALYIYSRNGKNVNYLIENTTAGGTCVNDNAIHYFQIYLPFGGANNSGIGEAHGYFGFKSFSNSRGIVKQPTKFSAVQFMYPPYNKWVQKMIDLSIKWF
jgi:aldehyde dehydrogenase (NAD+)